jgi:putative colanic acid biosynthesis acetyltransferase WcaF
VNAFRIHEQTSAYTSPWSLGVRVKVLIWEVCWSLLCAWTPKPFNAWRLFWIRRFGATVHGAPFVHGRATIVRPWNLTLHERSCLGDGAVAYCLDRIELGVGSTIAQGAYLCTGTHDFDHPHTPLKTAAISIGAYAFVGLRAIVLPGASIGADCVIGAGAVVTRDTEAGAVYAGNPARRVGTRRRRDAASSAVHQETLALITGSTGD